MFRQRGAVKAGRGGHGGEGGRHAVQLFCPWGAVLPRLLGGRHVECHLRNGKSVGQRVAVGVPVQQADFCVCLFGHRFAHSRRLLGTGRQVASLHHGGVLLTHEQFESLEGGIPHGVRHSVRHAALLDAGIHNFAGVIRQGQVPVGLHHQQRKDGQTGCPVRCQIFENLGHVWISLPFSGSGFPEPAFPIARSLRRSSASTSATMSL